MSSPKSTQLRAVRRERKNKTKMILHGKGVKSQPARGISRYARRVILKGMKFFAYLTISAIFGSAAFSVYAQPTDLFIVSPAPGEVVVGNSIDLKIKLAPRLTLIDSESNSIPQDGQGHLHVWIDALPSHNDELSYVPTNTLEHTLENVSPGLHTIYVEFFRNDHTSYEPRLIASVEFENTAQLISPQGNTGESGVNAPDSKSGIFLPPGRSNTIVSIIIIVAVLGILWYLFERRRK